MKLYWIILLIGISAFIGCKDEINIPPRTYETIEPGPYFPIWPGSSWTYEVTRRYHGNVNLTIEIDTFQRETEPEFKLHSYLIERCGDYRRGLVSETFSDSAYVPYFNGKPMYKYDTPGYPGCWGFCCGQEMLPVLKTEIGATFQKHFPTKLYPCSTLYTYVVHDTIVPGISDSVLHIVGEVWHKEIKKGHLYQKNVGQILYYEYDKELNDTIRKERLIDYHINFPK